MKNKMLIVGLTFLQRGRSRGTAESSGLSFQFSVACDGLSYHRNQRNPVQNATVVGVCPFLGSQGFSAALLSPSGSVWIESQQLSCGEVF